MTNTGVNRIHFFQGKVKIVKVLSILTDYFRRFVHCDKRWGFVSLWCTVDSDSKTILQCKGMKER